MSTAKRQHYVPQFYLRGFATGSGEPNLHVYDKRRRSHFIESVSTVASRKYFYDIPGLDDPQILEKNFGRFETTAAPALARALEALEAGTFVGFSEADRLDLAFFIALLYVRTEEVREDFAQLCESLYRQAGSHFGDAEDRLRAVRTLDGRARLHNELLLSSDVPKEIVKALGPRTWTVYRNRSPWPLLTSDNPVVVDSVDPKKTSVGPCRPWAAIFLPLSPEFLLGIMPFSTDGHVPVLPLRRREVTELNRRQIDRASLPFSPTPENGSE
jgi:hypothetical protein